MKENNQKKDLIVVPQVTPEIAKEEWRKYQELKKAITDDGDIQILEFKDKKTGKKKKQKFLKKSYWRKIATYFNITTEIVEEKPQQLGNQVIWHFTVKAIAPNGRSVIGVGSCALNESYRMNTIHNVRATAETRATNRAISNLVGGGEVSAEEAEQGMTVERIKEVFPEDKGSKPMSKAEQVKEKAKQWQNRK